MPRKLEGNYTHEQMRRAEALAAEILRDVPEADPVAALATLTLCLFSVVQGTYDPQFTDQQQNDAGILILMHYHLGPNFPFTNQQIIDAIKQKKAGK